MKFAIKPDDITHLTLGVLQKFWKSVKIWQSYRKFKGGNFFETQCIYCYYIIDNQHR